MRISKKSQYGLRSLFRLVQTDGYLSVKAISQKEDISADYLEKIFAELEEAELVKAKRGPSGGYQLAKKPEDIDLKMVLEVLENNLSLVECIEGGCARLDNCPTAPIWKKLDESIKEQFELITLKSLVQNYE